MSSRYRYISSWLISLTALAGYYYTSGAHAYSSFYLTAPEHQTLRQLIDEPSRALIRLIIHIHQYPRDDNARYWLAQMYIRCHNKISALRIAREGMHLHPSLRWKRLLLWLELQVYHESTTIYSDPSR